MSALCLVAVCGAKAARAAASSSSPPVQWALLGAATFVLVVDNGLRTLRALELARSVAALARHALASAAAEVEDAARAAAAQLASERRLWERRLWEAEQLAQAAEARQEQDQGLMLAVKQELDSLMDERERRGLQRFVSTQDYRRVLERHGLILGDQHVCHMIASVHGGADHPCNYAVLGGGWNSYSRHVHDDINCFLVGQAKARAAVEVSRRYGNRKGKRYDGPDSAKLVASGARKLKALLSQF